MTPEERGSKALVLVIDDEEAVHMGIRIRLSKEGVEVISALTGTEGIEIARQAEPDVILLDHRLDAADGLDGLQVLRTLQADEVTRRIAVIFVTGDDDRETRLKALDLGALDYIIKGGHEMEFRARVRNICKLQASMRLLEQRARVDGRTGLWNRTYFDDRLRSEIAEARRHMRPLSILMVDVDRFKRINDHYGHLFGDKVIQVLADILRSGRSSDIACRFGGDEFAVILPSTPLAEAVEVAERFRVKMREHAWREHPELVVTASFGVADLESAKDTGPGGRSALIALADEALFRAKGNAGEAGRDRVMTADESVA